MQQLKEGTKFYNDLTQLLVNVQNKVDDFCFARKAEREELCKDMQLAIANSANQPPPPTVPSYHAPPPSVPTSGSVPIQPQAPPVSAASVQPLPFAQNPYGGAPVGYYYPPPPLPSGYNPYAPPAPQQPQCKYLSCFTFFSHI